MLPCFVMTSCPILLINSINAAFPRAGGKGRCTGWWILFLGKMFCVPSLLGLPVFPIPLFGDVGVSCRFLPCAPVG